MRTGIEGPFILVPDDDCHWYVIPAAMRGRWEVWCGSADDNPPDYAVRIGGSPSLVEFTEYRIV